MSKHAETLRGEASKQLACLGVRLGYGAVLRYQGKGASEIASWCCGATDKNAVGLHAITCKGISSRRVVQINQLFDGPTYQNSWAFLFRSPFVANESSGGPAWQAHRHRTHPPTHITIRTVSVQCAQTRPSSPPRGFVVSILEFRVINYYSIVCIRHRVY